MRAQVSILSMQPPSSKTLGAARLPLKIHTNKKANKMSFIFYLKEPKKESLSSDISTITNMKKITYFVDESQT